MREEILRRLANAEAEHDVRVLFASESGSRAWGFESPDSDFDVRFVYVRPASWYLSFDVELRRDVIEYPIVDAIDCGGWDLRKALHLFTRTNGALLEWLNSPISYLERGSFASALRELAPRSVNMKALCYHYGRMARSNARECLQRDEVRLKKYFYVLRPLLAIRHIEQGHGLPPVRFQDLVASVAPTALRPSIADLLARKATTSELGVGEPIPAIGGFVASELERHGENFSGPGGSDSLAPDELRRTLNDLFRSAIHESAPRAA